MLSRNNFDTLALKYWQQSQLDLKEAQSSYKKKKFTTAAILACQAANNCLNAICISQQNHQNPNHSLSDMLAVCVAFDPSFRVLEKECLVLDQINAFSFFKENEKNQMQKDKSFDFIQAVETVMQQSEAIIKKNNYFKK